MCGDTGSTTDEKGEKRKKKRRKKSKSREKKRAHRVMSIKAAVCNIKKYITQNSASLSGAVASRSLPF